jgi:hypothetical protein
MPAPYTTYQGLQIPAGSFNHDGIAELLVRGLHMGPQWVIRAFPEQDPLDSWGCVFTDYPRSGTTLSFLIQPDDHSATQALDSAFVWLKDEARTHDWRVIRWERLNRPLPPWEQEPLARAQVADHRFVPVDGVTYADELPKTTYRADADADAELRDRGEHHGELPAGAAADARHRVESPPGSRPAR